MIIDVSAILKEDGKKILLDDCVSFEDTPFLGETYHFTEPVKVKGSIVNNSKALSLNAKCECTFVTHCARCMKDMEVKEGFEVDEILARADNAEVADDEDVIVFEGMSVDLDDIILDCFLMNVEPRYLCKEDCKGLCKTCGADLNEGDCGCSKDDINPQWAGLLDIIKENE